MSRVACFTQGQSMPRTPSRYIQSLYGLACFGALITALYFGRSVLIPVVLAVLLAFLLSPPMLALERRGLPRSPAAITVLLAAVLVFAAIGLLISQQLQLLLADLPRHREAIIAKVESLRDGVSESPLSGLSATLNEVR